MGKNCQWGLCNSDSRYPERSEGVQFIPFIKPWVDKPRCERWIRACARPHYQLNFANINKDRYICSKHFRDGKPTERFPDPEPARPSYGLETEVPKPLAKLSMGKSLFQPLGMRDSNLGQLSEQGYPRTPNPEVADLENGSEPRLMDIDEIKKELETNDYENEQRIENEQRVAPDIDECRLKPRIVSPAEIFSNPVKRRERTTHKKVLDITTKAAKQFKYSKRGSDIQSYCDNKDGDNENKRGARRGPYFELTGKEDFIHINESSVDCPNFECAKIKHKLLKDLRDALYEERQLVAKIEYLERISNINLDLLQLCLDKGQSPEVEVEFKKVVDMVQTVMNSQMWEVKAGKECKQITCGPQPMTRLVSNDQGNTSFVSTNSHSFSNTRNVNNDMAKDVINSNNSDNNIEKANLKNNSDITSQNHDNIINPAVANTKSSIQDNISPISTATSSMINTQNINMPSLNNGNLTQQQNSGTLPLLTNNFIPAPLFLQPHESGIPILLNTLPIPIMVTNFANLSSNGVLSTLNLDDDNCLNVCRKCVKMNPQSEDEQPKKSQFLLCYLCGKFINCKNDNADVYQFHMRRAHTKERPFECGKCHKSFYSKNCLINHNHHCQNEKRSHQCEECGKMFKVRGNLRLHQLVHKPDAKIYSCSQCNYKTKWSGNLKYHMKNWHKDSIASDSNPI